MGNNLTLMRYFKPKRFNSQSVILITGASSGIGKQLAVKYSKRSVKLVLAARNEQRLNEVANQCRDNGSQVLVVKCDVSIENQCEKLVTMCIKQFGQLDILILNAGITSHQYFMDIKKLDIFNQVMKTNFYGPVCITKYALPYLVKSQGRIVVISSFSGEVGLPMRTAYCASKFALNGFFQALRMETAPKRLIDIIIICPPSVNTNFRANAIDSSNTAQQDLKTSAPQMPLDKCCDTILDCVDRRMRKVFFPFKAYLAIYLRPFFPDYVDKKLQSRPHM